MNKKYIPFVVIAVVLVIDQIIKIYIKTTYALGGGFDILGLDWAKIYFIENKGMAFGMEYGGDTGKLLLSLFRIIMVGFLFYMIRDMIKKKESSGLIFCFSLIIAGAIGNIIDSAVYGMLFSESSYIGPPAVMFPESGGYAPFLHGKVVDMFYFPMFKTTYPEWVPKLGGEPFEFFRPVFNFADSSIFIGVVAILLFHRNYFSKK